MSSLYDISIAPMTHALHNLSAILTKAHSTTSTSPDTLISGRLTSDMKPLTFQIQTVSDTAKGLVARLLGTDPVSMPDTETTFEELQERISKTLAVLGDVKREDLEGKEGKEVLVKAGPMSLTFTAASYVITFAMPNFYFHEAMAYAILRMHGVELGKMDWLGKIGGL